MKMKTYEVALSNDSCLFDMESGFETIEEAVEWGKGRGRKYVMQIGVEGEPWRCVSVSVSRNTMFLYSPAGYWYHASIQHIKECFE
jgi:hypothetical protein